MLAHPPARPRPAMRRLARPRPIGAAGLGALLALSMAATMAPRVAADSGACLVGASATSLRPDTLEVMFAGCAYVVSSEAPPYAIDLVGAGHSRRLYQGDGATPDTTSGEVTWTIGGLPAGTYQIVNSGVVGFDADGNPVLGTGSLSIRVFGAQGTTPTPTPVPATPTPRPTVAASPTRTAQPTGTPQAKPSATSRPTPAPASGPAEARATAATAVALPHSTATAHPVTMLTAATASTPPSVAVTMAPTPTIAASTSSPAAPSGPALPLTGASRMGVAALTPAPSPQASLVAAVAAGAQRPHDEGTVVPIGISTVARPSAVTGATLRLVLVLAGGLVALAVVLGVVRLLRRRTAR